MPASLMPFKNDTNYDSDPDIPLSLSYPNWQAMKINQGLQGTLEILATNFDPSLKENKKFPISRKSDADRKKFTRAQRKAASARVFPGSFLEMKNMVREIFQVFFALKHLR